MNTEPLPRLNKYGLAAPCADDVRSAVAAVDYRNFTRNWRDICDQAEIGYHANLLDLDQMEALASALTGQGGQIGLIGSGFNVRVANYLALSKADDGVDRATDLGRKTFEGLVRTRVPEPQALAAIDSLNVLSTTAGLRLDDAAKQVARSVSRPIGLVTVGLGNAQYFAGNYGLSDFKALNGTPIEWSFCATTVRRNEPYVVSNAEEDVIQRMNPIVRFHNIKAYAGVPLRTAEDVVVGACCVFDTTSRDFSTEDIESLEQASALIMEELEISSQQR